MIPRCCELWPCLGLWPFNTDTNRSFHFIYGLLGHDGAVVDFSIDRDLEVSDLKRVALPMVEGEDETPLRIGTGNCGLPLVAHAWTKAEFRWEVEPTSPQLNKCFPDRPKPVGQSYATRPPNGILKQDPVDILITDHSKDDGRQLMKRGGPIWINWLQHCPDGKRHEGMIESWSAEEAVHPNGAFSKAHRKRMNQY
jgi:hypothetical protein